MSASGEVTEQQEWSERVERYSLLMSHIGEKGEKTHTKGMGQASRVTTQDMNMSEDLFSNTICQLGMTGMAIYTHICSSLDYFYLRKV